MTGQDLSEKAHHLDVTVWVGKSGIDPVVDELRSQLDDRELVKVKFLRSARAGTDVETLAADLADRADADVFRTRGNTAVIR
ncbi:RNA-binding protein [Halobacteriales archaeon QS_8_69_26]|nr:MAG: RNA-binding protein [Halobacteriales archaeon QS_8_69_26]